MGTAARAGVDHDVAEMVALAQARLSACMELEQGEEGDGPLDAARGSDLCEREGALVVEQPAQPAQLLDERHREVGDVTRVGQRAARPAARRARR